MKRVACLAAVMLLTAAAAFAQKPAAKQDESAKTEEAAVRAVVETYLRGLKHNDVESLKQAFWPEAKLFFVKRDGQLGQLTQTQWHAGFAASAGKEEQGSLRITALDITGDAASVKVFEDYPTSVYIDYLSLLKLDGHWKIVNKIYTSHSKQP